MSFSASSSWFDRNTLIHLRLPFSFFLLPVFCFGISQVSNVDVWNTVIIFIVLHFFIYPGSNIYNSYMDRDTGSIGGLRTPPPVTVKLFYVSMLFDAAGILLCFFADIRLVPLMLVYIGVSKAYSWRKIRLKKYPFAGWMVVAFFQGGYTFLLVHMTASDNFSADWFTKQNIAAMLLATLLIGGFYPVTQIYQHEEDSGRGDITISYRLGITGTFVFTAILFALSVAVAGWYFGEYYSVQQFSVFLLCQIPSLVYFFLWFSKCLRDRSFADFSHTMRMMLISSSGMTVFFVILFFLNH